MTEAVVTINATAGFTPSQIIVQPSEPVSWLNLDNQLHAIVFREISSPLLHVGRQWTWRFMKCGRHDYSCVHQDQNSKCWRGGTVFVSLAPSVAREELLMQRKVDPLPFAERVRNLQALGYCLEP